ILNWSTLPREAKVAKLLEGERIFEMPVEKVVAFLRELLEGGRTLEFLRILRHFSKGLFVPAMARRASVAGAFEQVADWVEIPGMPVPAMDELMEILGRAWGGEKDPNVHQAISRGVEHVIWFWVQGGNPARAHTLYTNLQDQVTEMSPPAPWKDRATIDLLGRLGSPERMGLLLNQLFHTEKLEATSKIYPYLRMLGAAGAQGLVHRLSEETDRGRRGRLADALKSFGHIAEGPLLESLMAPEWFVVRNALNVLGEIADSERIPDLLPSLGHEDLRVVAAAVRAIGRMGGRQAESALVPMLAHRDTDTLLEVIFALGELKSKNAVPGLIELLQSGGSRPKPAQAKILEKAIETLGLLGSTSAIPFLEELLARRRSFFRDSRQPLNLRVAALKALAAFNTEEAQLSIERAIAAEPKGSERDALLEALSQTLV
ncbi:MAG: HEAT repeat domain-containing protein, partial [Holophaga sp.]|nr:HEAT repeat domain-containing protein [Holophaga sp.]